MVAHFLIQKFFIMWNLMKKDPRVVDKMLESSVSPLFSSSIPRLPPSYCLHVLSSSPPALPLITCSFNSGLDCYFLLIYTLEYYIPPPSTLYWLSFSFLLQNQPSQKETSVKSGLASAFPSVKIKSADEMKKETSLGRWTCYWLETRSTS